MHSNIDNTVELISSDINAQMAKKINLKYKAARIDSVFPIKEGKNMLFMDDSVYLTDLTTLGTEKIIDSRVRDQLMTNYHFIDWPVQNDFTFFIIRNKESQEEIWITDGSPENTKMIAGPEFKSNTGIFDTCEIQSCRSFVIDDKHLGLYLKAKDFTYYLVKINLDTLSIVNQVEFSSDFNPYMKVFPDKFALLSLRNGGVYSSYLIGDDLSLTKLTSASQSNSDFAFFNDSSIALEDGRIIFAARTTSTNRVNFYISDGTVAGTDVFGNYPLTTNVTEARMRYSNNPVTGFKTSAGIYLTVQGPKVFQIDPQANTVSEVADVSAHIAGSDMVVLGDNYLYLLLDTSSKNTIVSVSLSDYSVTKIYDQAVAAMTPMSYFGGQGDEYFIATQRYSLSEYHLIYINGNTATDPSAVDEEGNEIKFYNAGATDNAFFINSKWYVTGADITGKNKLFEFDGVNFVKSAVLASNQSLRTAELHKLGDKLLFELEDEVSYGALYKARLSDFGIQKIGNFNLSKARINSSKWLDLGLKSFISIDDNLIGSELYEINSSGSADLVVDFALRDGGIGTECATTLSKIMCLDWDFSFNLTVTDGTAGGTNLFLSKADIYSMDSEEDGMQYMILSNDNYFFLNYYNLPGGGYTDIVKTDGVAAVDFGASSSWGVDYGASFISDGMGKFLFTEMSQGPIIANGNLAETENIHNAAVTDDVWDLGYHGGYWYMGYSDASWDYTLAVTDGTEAGTTAVLHDFNVGDTDEIYFTGPANDGKFLFLADDVASGLGLELWVTNGTPAGTQMLKDLVPGASGLNYALSFGVLSNYSLLQIWADGTDYDGIYLTDTSTGNLTKIIDGYKEGSDYSKALIKNDAAYFMATDNANPNICNFWKVDGSDGSVTKLGSYEPVAAENNTCDTLMIDTTNYIYFLAYTPSKGIELYQTDGSLGGTKLFLDTITGEKSLFKNNDPKLKIKANKLFFFGEESIQGAGLWSADIEI